MIDYDTDTGHIKITRTAGDSRRVIVSLLFCFVSFVVAMVVSTQINTPDHVLVTLVFDVVLSVCLLFGVRFLPVTLGVVHKPRVSRLGIAVIAVCWLVVFGVAQAFGSFIASHFAEVNSLTTHTASGPVVVLVTTVIAAPVAEELLFRRMFLPLFADVFSGFRLSSSVSIALSLVFSTSLFALSHGTLYQFVSTFLLGFFCAVIYLVTGRIWVSVLLHGLFNFAALTPLVYLFVLVCFTTTSF